MFPANNFGDSFAGNLRFAIFAINFFGHFKYLYFSTLSYKKVFKKSKGNSLIFNELPYYFSTKFDEEPQKSLFFTPNASEDASRTIGGLFEGSSSNFVLK